MSWLDPDGAIFIFGDFGDRIELGIGENIGRRFNIGERDEDGAILDGPVGAGGELDGAPPRCHLDALTGCHAIAGERDGVEARGRSRLKYLNQ